MLGLLGVVFVTLKLTGHIDWSWWWVTAPFWGGFALFLVISAAMLVFALIVDRVQKAQRAKRRAALRM